MLERVKLVLAASLFQCLYNVIARGSESVRVTQNALHQFEH